MEIKFYNSKAEINRVNKILHLTEVITLEGTIKNSCSIINPSIIIQSNTIIDANYVYIPEFKRYYFINNITNISLDMWQFDMSVDVLMSFRNDILKLNVVVGRQEYDNNPYIIDGLVITDNEPLIEIIEEDIEQFTVQKDSNYQTSPFALICVSEV